MATCPEPKSVSLTERTRFSSTALYQVGAVQSLCALSYALSCDEKIPFELARKLMELAEELRAVVIPPLTFEEA